MNRPYVSKLVRQLISEVEDPMPSPQTAKPANAVRPPPTKEERDLFKKSSITLTISDSDAGWLYNQLSIAEDENGRVVPKAKKLMAQLDKSVSKDGSVTLTVSCPDSHWFYNQLSLAEDADGSLEPKAKALMDQIKSALEAKDMW